MNQGEGGEEVVGFKLYLAAHADEVSQPLPMGDYNMVQILVWIESKATGLGGDPVVARVQASPDLDLWENVSGASVSLSSAPKSATASSYSSLAITAPYIRVRYTGGGDDVLMGVSLRFSRT